MGQGVHLRSVGIGFMALWLVMAAVGAGAEPLPSADGPEPRTALVGPSFRVSGALAVEEESDAAVAYDPVNDQYLVVWSDDRDAAVRGSDIYGQRVSGSGARIGGNLRITGPSATADAVQPAVAYDSTTDRFLVVWTDLRNSGTRGSDIYGQRVSGSGARIGGNFRISGAAALSSESAPAVAYDSVNGRHLVVWVDGRSFGTRSWDIYGQRVTAAGDRLGGNFRISGGAAIEDDERPAVAYSSTSQVFLVVWEDRRDLATRGQDVYGQRVTAAGSRVGGNIRISGAAATEADLRPDVAYTPAGDRFVVVWSDWRNLAVSDTDIYGQRMSPSGARIGGNFRISGPSATDEEANPHVGLNPTTNQYLVVWRDGRDLATRGFDVYGQRLTLTGARVGGNFRVSRPGATAGEVQPALAFNPSANQFLIVWGDSRDFSTRDWDIYGQRVTG